MAIPKNDFLILDPEGRAENGKNKWYPEMNG